MIPWKFCQDWLNTDWENWFWNVWEKYRFSKKSEKIRKKPLKRNYFFHIFWTLGSQGKEGRVDIPRNMKKSENHCTLMYMSTSFSIPCFWCSCPCPCPCPSPCPSLCPCTCICPCSCSHPCKFPCAFVSAHVYAHVYPHVHVYVYVHVHIYVLVSMSMSTAGEFKTDQLLMFREIK